jgi:GMP synthase (glutamine-hydrolysing)
MKIHAILHASFETVGSIETWAAENKHSLTLTHSYLHQALPDVDAFDFLIIMGGPQSPREQDIYPYLSDEIKLIRRAISANKLVLGFCLGAQLIGEALGASTLRSPAKEVGIWPIHLTEDGKKDPLFQSFGNSFDVVHWHNDMPGIPEGAVLLAASEGCPYQAFRYNDRVYGFQFHMEITQENAKIMCQHCPDDLKPSKFTQSKEDLLNSDFDSVNQKMNIILDRFTKSETILASKPIHRIMCGE